MADGISMAYAWCLRRELHLQLMHSPYGSGVMGDIKPSSVPDGRTGDQGTVEFPDGSCIDWDWDDGVFECERRQFTYPFNSDDILFAT